MFLKSFKKISYQVPPPPPDTIKTLKFFQIFEEFCFQETAFFKDNVFHVVQILKENNLNIIWDLVRFLMKYHQGFLHNVA